MPRKNMSAAASVASSKSNALSRLNGIETAHRKSAATNARRLPRRRPHTGTPDVAAAKPAPAAKPAAAAKGPAPALPAKPQEPRATGPALLVPAVPDTFPPESEAAPFLVPGRPAAVDSSQTRAGRARTYV